MGWNLTGKFGIHSGKTLRRYPTRKGAYVNQRLQWGLPRSRNEFAVVKEVNFGNSSRILDPKSVKFAFEDGGLPLEEDSLVYSLNKHKRWLLPDMLKDNVRELVDEEITLHSELHNNDNSETKNSIKKHKKGSKQNTDSTVRVSVVERHSANEAHKYSPDCIGVTSNVFNPTPCPTLHSSDPERKPSKCYSHVGDLKPEVSGTDVEVYYEFLSPFPKKAWPSHRQCRKYRRNSIDEVVGSKSKKKGKGRRNKWDQLNDIQSDESLEEFNKCDMLDGGNDDVFQEYIVEPFNSEFTFSIGASIRDAIQAKNKKNTEEFYSGSKDHVPTLSIPTVYGKGQAVYIDNDTELSNHCDMGGNTPNPITEGKSMPLSKDKKNRIDLLAKDITSDHLSNEFGSNYVEGDISPRKFIIKVELNETVPNDDFCLLFEVPDTPCKQDAVRASVVISLPITEQLPSMLHETIKSELNKLQNDSPLTVRAIADLVMEKIASKVTFSPNDVPQRKSFMKVPVEFIQQVCKQESEVCDLKKAIRYSLRSEERIGAACLGLSKCENRNGKEKLCCEICYVEEDMDHQCIDATNFTQLLHCSHQFCNECATSYIATCIEAGQSQITCPHYNCKTTVTEPLIWSCTNTKLYQKHRNINLENLINANPCLRHCPATDCPQLAYVTPIDEKQSNSVPVVCDCGLVWCFSCQKDAHWPASCKEADSFHKEFREQREYIKMLRFPGLVSSVHVKKCPFCHHPIEKGFGCQHMSCRCGQQFCWECLYPYLDHDWDLCHTRKKELEEVELTPVHGANHEKYWKIAVANSLERNGKNFFVLKQLTERAKQVQNAHDLVANNPKTSTCRLVKSYIEKNIACLVEDVFHFKNLANFVLENTAASLAVSKSKLVGKSLDRDMEVLDFIIQRCSEVLFKPVLLFEEGKLETVRKLLKHGEESIRNINRLVQTNRKN